MIRRVKTRCNADVGSCLLSGVLGRTQITACKTSPVPQSSRVPGDGRSVHCVENSRIAAREECSPRELSLTALRKPS